MFDKLSDRLKKFQIPQIFFLNSTFFKHLSARRKYGVKGVFGKNVIARLKIVAQVHYMHL
jgi:hypothetical protein